MKKLLALFVTLTLFCSFSSTALAADNGTSVGSDTPVSSSNTGDTTVNITYATGSEGQLSVTVPISVTLAVKADAAAQENVLGPTVYNIINKSAFAVKVTNVAVTAQAGFAIASPAPTDTDIGSITLKNSKETAATALSAWTADVSGNANWKMANGSVADNSNKINVLFGGKVTNIKQDLQTAVPAFKITYTVAAGA